MGLKSEKFKGLMYSPKFWGLCFLSLIPIFGVVYTLLGKDSIQISEQHSENIIWWLESMYFSVITITTLGFGDMFPVSTGAKIAVIVEALAGVSVIGFFLNAVGYQRAKLDSEEEKMERKKLYYNSELHKLKRSYRIIKENIDEYLEIAITLTYPMKQRGSSMNLIYNPDFDFHNISDLYKFSLRLRFPILEPAIVSFGKVKKELIASLLNLFNQVDMSLWQDLEIKILNLLNDFKRYDSQDSLESNLHMTLGGKPAHEEDAKFISSWTGEINYHPSNAINKYIDLYFLLRSSIPQVSELKNMMDIILTTKDSAK